MSDRVQGFLQCENTTASAMILHWWNFSLKSLAKSKIGRCCLISAALSKVFHESRFWGDTRFESESPSEQWMVDTCFHSRLLLPSTEVGFIIT